MSRRKPFPPPPSPPLRNRPPTFTTRPASVLSEIPTPPGIAAGFAHPGCTEVRCWRFGNCTVIRSRELGRYHLSIRGPGRYPAWDEVAEVRYALLPRDLTYAMLLPPMDQYFNMDEYVFQLIEVAEADRGYQRIPGESS